MDRKGKALPMSWGVVVERGGVVSGCVVRGYVMRGYIMRGYVMRVCYEGML